jgi:hypothetical protein
VKRVSTHDEFPASNAGTYPERNADMYFGGLPELPISPVLPGFGNLALSNQPGQIASIAMIASIARISNGALLKFRR